MPAIVGPQTLTVGATTPVPDPYQSGGNPSVACQIQNSSPYQLQVVAGAETLSIQPFFAQTVAITGAPMTVEPLPQTGLSVACTLTFAFLLGTPRGSGIMLPDGTWVEVPPQQDGPLTAAAIASALVTQGSVDKIANGGPTAIGLGSSNLVGGSGAPALHAYQTLFLSVAYSPAPPVGLFMIGTRFPSGGGPALNFPQAVVYPNGPAAYNTSIMPFACQAGDGIDVQVTPTVAGNITWTIYGSTAAWPQVVQYRSDGRPYPIGLQAAGSSSPGTNLVAAPGAVGVRILIKSITLTCITASVSLQATLQGSLRTIAILGVAGSSDSRVFESGLLCDAGTALAFAGAGTGNASVVYDLVI